MIFNPFRDWHFAWWEVSLIKMCLLSLGILCGLYFREYLIDLTWLWWAVFIVTTLYFLVRIVKEPTR